MIGIKRLLGFEPAPVEPEPVAPALGEMDWLDELIIAVHLVDQNLHSACIHEFECEKCMAAREHRVHFIERTTPALRHVPKERYQLALGRWLASEDYQQHQKWRGEERIRTAHLWVSPSMSGVLDGSLNTDLSFKEDDLKV